MAVAALIRGTRWPRPDRARGANNGKPIDLPASTPGQPAIQDSRFRRIQVAHDRQRAGADDAVLAAAGLEARPDGATAAGY